MKVLVFVWMLFSSLNLIAQFDRAIDHRTNIPIMFEYEEGIYPKEWYPEPICAEGINLSMTERVRSSKIIKKALKKYPIQVCQKNLEKVYILEILSFYNIEFGGSNHKNKVYISNQGEKNAYTDDHIERIFHAEFSSILLRNYPKYLSLSKWSNINPKGFEYGSGGVNALKKGKDSEQASESLYKNGFLSEYALSSLENDFNAYAKQLFVNNGDFWNLYKQYPRIRQKTKLIIDFYQKINPIFTLNYFREIGR